jgi:hypothetical protein
VALAAPDLAWQATHGWPNLEVFHALQIQAGANRITYWPAQIFFTGPALTPIWVAGLVWSLRNPAARPFRPLGIACAVAIAAQFILGGKPYYPGGLTRSCSRPAGWPPSAGWPVARSRRLTSRNPRQARWCRQAGRGHAGQRGHRAADRAAGAARPGAAHGAAAEDQL